MNLEFKNIGHNYGDPASAKSPAAPALVNVDLSVPSGEVTCLLGSSGCGKTTLLNLAAGLLDVQQGSIALDGEILADPSRSPPPEHRPIGLVFQDGALFPHMSIADNILFGVPKSERRKALSDRWLDMIGLPALGERFPSSLSGGQAQRVALARAMAPQPAILLLDEPFASIDVVLRRDLRRSCRRLLREQGATAIMVTHDPEEAMDIADTIAVMDKGAIVQTGSPGTLYNAPATLAVGAMFGESRVVEAAVKDGALHTPFGVWPISSLADQAPEGAQLELLIREGALALAADATGLAVKDIRKTGRNSRITLANEAGALINVYTDANEPIPAGDHLAIQPKERSILAFAKDA